MKFELCVSFYFYIVSVCSQWMYHCFHARGPCVVIKLICYLLYLFAVLKYHFQFVGSIFSHI